MKVTVTFEIPEETARLFRQSSIERVINTSLTLMRYNNADKHPDWTVNHEDWQEWKPVVVSMWQGVSDAIYRESIKMEPNEHAWLIMKGVYYCPADCLAHVVLVKRGWREIHFLDVYGQLYVKLKSP